MQVFVFASGSSGNCLLVSSGETYILIDAGISMRRMTEALAAAGHTWQDIGGVLITHEHSDHISGLNMLVRHHAVPVYAPHTVAARLSGRFPDLTDNLHILPVGSPVALGNVRVSAFHTPHDTDESVGYRIDSDDGSFAIATDMGHITEEIIEALTGAYTVLIEANHDEGLLVSGSYPFSLKRRILSDNGHLSNAGCAELARRLALSGTRHIILGHLSRENNSPALAEGTVAALLTGLPVKLSVAPAFGCLAAGCGKEALCSQSG